MDFDLAPGVDHGLVLGRGRFGRRDARLGGGGLVGHVVVHGERSGVEHRQVREHAPGGDREAARPPVAAEVENHAGQRVDGQDVAGPQQQEAVDQPEGEQQQLSPVVDRRALAAGREHGDSDAEEHREQGPHGAFEQQLDGEVDAEVDAVHRAVHGRVRVRPERQSEGQDVEQENAQHGGTADGVDRLDALARFRRGEFGHGRTIAPGHPRPGA